MSIIIEIGVTRIHDLFLSGATILPQISAALSLSVNVELETWIIWRVFEYEENR